MQGKAPKMTCQQSSCLQCCTGTTRGSHSILQHALIQSVLAQDEEAQTGKRCQYKIYKVKKNLPLAIDTKQMSLKYQNSELFEIHFRVNSPYL